MKKVYILYGRILADTGANGKVTAFQKMLGIFGSEATAKRYEVVVNPLKDVNIDSVEYVVEEYPVISDEDINDLQSPN